MKAFLAALAVIILAQFVPDGCRTETVFLNGRTVICSICCVAGNCTRVCS